MPRFLIYLVAFLSGVIGVLAFSPFDYWWCAYLSVFSLLVSIQISSQNVKEPFENCPNNCNKSEQRYQKNRKKRTALWSAFFWGLGFFTFGLNWLNVSIHQFGGTPLWVSYGLVVLLAAYLSLFPVLFAWLIQKLDVRTPIIYPIVWLFTEWLRSWLFTGFPWLQFGYSQIDSPFFGIAPMFGVQGETFFVILISALFLQIFLAWFKRESKPIAQTLINLLLTALLGSLAFYLGKVDYVKPDNSRALNITLVQGNIEQNLKWDPAYLMQTLDTYQRLITQHLDKTDLIILPEAALPALENQLQPFFQGLQYVSAQNHTPVMVGSIYLDESRNRLFNSIVVVGEENEPYDLLNSQRYIKSHLVPFGEYVPIESILRPLGAVFNLPMSNFAAGEWAQKSLLVKSRTFLPAICYEIIFGEQLQKNWQVGTGYLLTLSNDAWFGSSIGPWQHLQMARMRALELGRPLIRATNTGITAFIDAKGRLVAQAPQFVETVLTHKISPTIGKTPYAVLGDKPLYWLSAILFALHFGTRWLRKRLLQVVTKDGHHSNN